MSVESVKWLLGFAGLFFIGWYNLRRQDAQAEKNRGLQQELALKQVDHQKQLAIENLSRADKKDRTARQADFVFKWTEQRAKVLNELQFLIHDYALDCDRAVTQLTKDQYQVKAEELLTQESEMIRKAVEFGLLPSNLRTEESTALTHALFRKLEGAYNLRSSIAKFRYEFPFDKAGCDAKSKELFDVLVELSDFVMKVYMWERRRQFLCSTLPFEEWPKWVQDDLDFLAGLWPAEPSDS